MSKCTLCNKLCNSSSNCMSGYGPDDADLMFCGEAPGEEEDKQGIPFVGRAGKYLHRHVFKGAGIDAAYVRLTNPVRCRPPQNRSPNIAEIRNCRQYLEEEVELVQPKVIVAMGNIALHSIIPFKRKKDPQEDKATWKSKGLTGITRWQGKVIWHSEFNCYVIPTFHPSALARDSSEGIEYRLNLVVKDVEQAILYSQRPRVKVPPIRKILADTEEKVIKVLQGVAKVDVVGFDIETGDFDPRTSDIIGVGIADKPNRGFFLLWDVIKNSAECMHLFKRFLTDQNQLKVIHHAEFEERYIRMKKLKFTCPYVDTLVAAALVDENFGKGLKDLTWRYLPFGGYEQELDDYRVANRIKSFADIPIDFLYPYGVMDSTNALQLWHLFEPQLEEQCLMPLYKKILMPVRKVMTDAEIAGFTVDIKRAKKLSNKCDQVVEKLFGRMHAIAGVEINPRSPKQLGDLLYNKLGMKPLKKTKTGYSCDADSLEFTLTNSKNKRGERFVRTLLDVRFIQSMQSKFIKPIIKNAWKDGKIHTRYNIAGTVTGRTSCSDPGIHNEPRDRLIRSLFIASDGCKLIHADLERTELTILAAYSRDPVLIEALKGDPHAEVYKFMFGKPDSYQPTEDDRFVGKTLNFGTVYGRGFLSIAKAIGVSPKKAKGLIEKYFGKLKGVKRWLSKNIQDTKERGYTVSFFKRRRRLPGINSDDRELVARSCRQANNSAIQSAAADYTYIGLVRTSREIKKRQLRAKIVHTVHDCIVVDCPIEEIKEVKLIIKEAFEKRVKAVPIQMRVDLEVMDRWGEKNDSKLYEVLKKVS